MTDLIQTPLSWHLFLKEQGAYFNHHITTQDSVFFDSSNNQNQDLQNNFMVPLTDLGLLAFSGKDAASFLHTQLTNAVVTLDLITAKLAGYCNAKGRLLATVLMWKNTDHIIIQLPRTLQLIIQQRLRVFILRAQVKITDINSELISLGFIENTVSNVLQKWFPILPIKLYSKIDNSHGTLIKIANSRNASRYQWITSAQQAINAWPILKKTFTPISTSAWRLTNIYAGIPMINKATQEKFVPQMINFELINGIDFKKGCYPGQEVIARTQYLGKLKRRTILALINANTVDSGMEVFSNKDPTQPCGTIVNAELTFTENWWACLVEIKLLTINNNTIHLGTNNGPLLQIHALPYNLM